LKVKITVAKYVAKMVSTTSSGVLSSFFEYFLADGLTDCEDPDCCIDIACRESLHCRIAPDPMEILLRKQPPSSGASFYDRMRFLVEDDSVQSYATLSSFNQTFVPLSSLQLNAFTSLNQSIDQ